MKRALLLSAGVFIVMSLSNASCLQAQSVPMTLTTQGTNNVLNI